MTLTLRIIKAFMLMMIAARSTSVQRQALTLSIEICAKEW